MNYNSVDEILAAGTTNMTVLRDNIQQDNGVDTIDGVNWFKFNNTTASKIYVSGNSFIGFGSSTEHLKVNRRDSVLYSLYREEGTLYNTYNFLKIRWSGYSTFSTSYPVEYDVILWDTGDISLHMIAFPTYRDTGVYSLICSSYVCNYTVTESSPNATFTKTDKGFEVSYEIINLAKPCEKRYLIKSGNSYYTVIDNTLSQISATSLTSDTFLTEGVTDIPNIDLLRELQSPELLYWMDVDNELRRGLVVNGSYPYPQTLYYDTYDIAKQTGIENIGVVASNDVKFAVTVDDGVTWRYYDGDNWVVAKTNTDGMNAQTINDLNGEVWAEIISSVFKFRCVLTSDDSSASKLFIKYNEE